MLNKLNSIIIFVLIYVGVSSTYHWVISDYTDDIARLQGIVGLGFAAVLNMLRE